MCNTAKMFSFGPNPTREKKAWSSSTCLLYVCSADMSRCCTGSCREDTSKSSTGSCCPGVAQPLWHKYVQEQHRLLQSRYVRCSSIPCNVDMSKSSTGSCCRGPAQPLCYKHVQEQHRLHCQTQNSYLQCRHFQVLLRPLQSIHV